MNNRIAELEKQCWSPRVEGALVDGQLHFDTAKFAELIVQECVQVCEQGTATQTTSSGAASMIKQHFGVEQC
jgi:hypothetical protein